MFLKEVLAIPCVKQKAWIMIQVMKFEDSMEEMELDITAVETLLHHLENGLTMDRVMKVAKAFHQEMIQKRLIEKAPFSLAEMYHFFESNEPKLDPKRSRLSSPTIRVSSPNRRDSRKEIQPLDSLLYDRVL